MNRPALALCLATLSLGCASSAPPADAPAPTDPGRLLASEEAEARSRAVAAPESTKPAPCTNFPRPGVLRRSAVVATVDRGLGPWLSGVSVVPARDGRRFVGWEIQRLYPDDPCYQVVDLRPGDVVTRVNGSSLEKPEQANQVFQGLRAAKSLDVELVRGGAARRVSLAIED